MDLENNRELITKLNKAFIQKNRKKAFDGYQSVTILEKTLENLSICIRIDNNDKLKDNYENLLIGIFRKYEKENYADDSQQKKRGIYQIMYIERNLFRKAFGDEEFQLSQGCKRKIISIYVNIWTSHIRQKEIEIDWKYPDIGSCIEEREWREVTRKIYAGLEVENKKKLIECILSGYRKEYYNNRKFSEGSNYYKEIVKMLMCEMVKAVSEDSEQETTFCSIFQQCMDIDELQDYITGRLCDLVTEYDKISVCKMVDLLKVENRLCIVVYQVVYYSVYRNRTEWKYINIEFIKWLLRRIDFEDFGKSKINTSLLKCRMGNRVAEEIDSLFASYMKEELTGELLEKIKEEAYLDPFYIGMIKLCIDGYVYMVNLKMSKELREYFIIKPF